MVERPCSLIQIREAQILLFFVFFNPPLQSNRCDFLPVDIKRGRPGTRDYLLLEKQSDVVVVFCVLCFSNTLTN
jgi:hypothetical protein